ncbi:MAG: hypothetical protein ACOZIN_17125 [Myxococcota bacterium]
MTTPEEIERIRLRLQALPPRSAQVLYLRQVQGMNREACARFYGVTLPALDVMTLRAARAYAQTPAPLPREEEEALGARLAFALEGSATSTPAPPELVAPLTRLREVGPMLRQRMEEAEREEESSPSRRRETWIRRALVVLIVALSAYFYLDRQGSDTPRPPARRFVPR